MLLGTRGFLAVATHREVMMHAAAIGHRFDLDILAGVLGLRPSQLRSAIRLACAHQLLEPVEGSADTFQFRDSLAREALYKELVVAQLRPLHRRIGKALERLSNARREQIETLPHQLAHHWWAAGDRARGSRYNEAAGDRARALHAHNEALLHYHRALHVLGHRSAARIRIEQKIRAIE